MFEQNPTKFETNWTKFVKKQITFFKILKIFQEIHTLKSMAANFWSQKRLLLNFFLRKAQRF